MKIGIVSDIHGDFDGLRRALDLLDKLGAEEVICAGDLLERGAQGDAVAALIREWGIPCVKGNHEYIAISKDESMRQRGSAEGLRHQPLSQETVNFVAGLPDSLRLERAGVGLLIAHGTPWSDFVYLYPETREAVYRRVADDARAANAAVVILGHTHIPMRADVGQIRIVNPGSVYACGSRTCAVLSLPDRAFTVYTIGQGKPVESVAAVEY